MSCGRSHLPPPPPWRSCNSSNRTTWIRWFYQSSYYVAADGADKPYSLFLAALEATKQHAVAKVAMHNREHVVLIRPSEGALLLHTLFYSGELHRANKREAPKAKYSAKEFTLAKSLVAHLTAPFKPEQFHDSYRENVERLIREKSKGKAITLTPQPKKAPVVDLMEALKQSLAARPGKPMESGRGVKKRRAA
ncbi:MAG: Ku protein [Acidobacteriota bacterium]